MVGLAPMDFVSLYFHVCDHLILRLPALCPMISFPCMAMNPLHMHLNHIVRTQWWRCVDSLRFVSAAPSLAVMS